MNLISKVKYTAIGSRWLDIVIPWAKILAPEKTDEIRIGNENLILMARERIKHASCKSLKDSLENIHLLSEEEEDRRRSVDARLSTIVGLSSIAATIATGIIVAQAGGPLKISNISGRFVLSAVALYLIVQLCDAIYWAIRGQSRLDYKVNKIEAFLPQEDISEEEQLRCRIIKKIEHLQFNQESTSKKVTAMAVAHQAAKNFACGILVLSIIGMLLVSREPAVSPLLEALRTNAELRDQLKGPPGPDGPIGPAGKQGPKGDAARPMPDIQIERSRKQPNEPGKTGSG